MVTSNKDMWPGSMRFSKNGKQRMGQPGPRRYASGLKRCREGHRRLDHNQGKSYGWMNQPTAFHFTWLASQLFTRLPTWLPWFTLHFLVEGGAS